MKPGVAIFWFRRDLRLDDNTALFFALSENTNVFPIFIFDKNILNKLDDKYDRRVDFIHQQLNLLNQKLIKVGSALSVYHDEPQNVFADLHSKFDIKNVYANHDYEPYATQRDNNIRVLLQSYGISFHTYKDQVIFEKSEVVKDDGTPYGVFTPYAKKWKTNLSVRPFMCYDSHLHFSSFYKTLAKEIPAIEFFGFVKTDLQNISSNINVDIIKHYHETRNYPALAGTSRLSAHLRFGTISIRALCEKAEALNEVYLNELIWREFYMMILWHYPHVAERAYKPSYDRIEWLNNEHDFDAWCYGKTGYPLVDAGMRELNSTGFMHNRVRMITASFLVKHLLIDWRWGEAYFAKKLLDFDLAANNGGWQWVAGSGCDGAPYFRIFNPEEQAKKFDPESKYIKKWVPEFSTQNYTQPIVDHAFARKRCLEKFKKAMAEK